MKLADVYVPIRMARRYCVVFARVGARRDIPVLDVIAKDHREMELAVLHYVAPLLPEVRYVGIAVDMTERTGRIYATGTTYDEPLQGLFTFTELSN